MRRVERDVRWRGRAPRGSATHQPAVTTGSLNRMTAVFAAAGLLAALAGCSGSGAPSEGQSADQTGSAPPAGELLVFAAASLSSTFTEIGERFEASHPGSAVEFNFAGSTDLVAQLQQGAPADVFASADASTMDRAASDDLLSGTPTVFATNTMMIAVPPDNPAGIAGFADLARPGVQVVVCAPEVPCGSATQRVEANTGVSLDPVSEESSVTDVLNKAATGEADAGVVYVTDVQGSAGRVMGIEIPADVNTVNSYPIAVLAGSAVPGLAQQFQAMVTGPEGRKVLADAGFGAP